MKKKDFIKLLEGIGDDEHIYIHAAGVEYCELLDPKLERCEVKLPDTNGGFVQESIENTGLFAFIIEPNDND